MFVYGSPESAAVAFSDLAQALTTKYQIELGANIYKGLMGWYLSDFVVSNTFDPHAGVGYQIDIMPPSAAMGETGGYVHTHPGYDTFSKGDLLFGIGQARDAYVSLPNMRVYQFGYAKYVNAGSPELTNAGALMDPAYVRMTRAERIGK
jgi:hypothetical protein